ncbi:iron-sulfur cluster-binding protein [Paenibacillus psychroresistens]|uniref:Iron-sulfur cluster-binding protein n=1 Tax=Paenibacillus psychroresistens TaxID=1778678 RepID=A0A6B8RNY0_9BACL|nr:LutB/LldF family L-lactate oxidation iron-sulfur protein [Paenibacillus psychroresistens]QGQ98061.1 iron-sulfur cluster-binding protein [Paenibacillus psychroresistens]
MKINTAIHQLMKNDFLRKSVRNVTGNLRNGRLDNIALNPDYEQLRTQGQEIRTRTIEQLDVHLRELVKNFKANGVKVIFAKDAAEVVDQVLHIAKEHDAKSVAKSKSMVSEEVHLNHHLKEHGIEVFETDLGEFIIQLADEPPSHIVMPSLHKSREEIQQLFRDHHNYDLTTDSDELVAFARKILRESFMRADIGITGCNFAVAESGTVVILTNEGNGRFVTTLPRVQISIMGMERIVPTLEELDPLLTLLTTGANGQRSTMYINMINGPKLSEENDGVEDVYVIIVDNGRSKLLGTKFQEALNCIRCGACLNVCPVFSQVGGHAYESPYSGPIGAVISPLILGMEQHGELSYASSLCGACDEACPVKIPLHHFLLDIRELDVQSGKHGRIEALAFRIWAATFSSFGMYKSSQKAAYWGVKLLAMGKDNLSMRLPGLKNWTNTRNFPLFSRRTFLQQYKQSKKTEQKPKPGVKANSDSVRGENL